MITRSPTEFFRHAATLAADRSATAKAAFVVTPLGFRLAAQSATDNTYMAGAEAFDADAALAQHRELQRRLSLILPTIAFPGSAETPDAVFPNNAFGTACGTAIVGRMRHEVRQRETQRTDIRRFFSDVLGYDIVDLSLQDHPAELTGALVMDRARGLGFFGLSERCDEEGARLMHQAFGLRASLLFDLAPGEYHTNVVLAILAGRAAVVCPNGFADPAIPQAIADFYAPSAVICSAEEHAAFVGNCISVSSDTVWMSQRAADALSAPHRDVLNAAGFKVESVALDAIEAAGGSLRCCVGEIF